jgi:putative spermidine/putrescine transport system permease protein
MTATTRPSVSKSPLLDKKQFLLLTRGTLFPLLMLFGAIVIIGLPLLMAVLWSLVDPDFPWSYPDVFPTRLSLYHWDYVFRFTGITKAIITSYTIAPLATIMAFILSLPTAYAIANYDFPGKEIIRIIILLPIILPGMVVALFLSRVFLFLDLSQSLFGLVLGHTLLGMPYMLRLLSTSFEAIPKEIGDAASNLGATNFYRLKEVFIPMLLPGIFAGSIFTFITSLEEFNLTFVIGTPSYQTIPTVLFAFLGYHFVRTNAAVVSLILMVPNVILLFIADRFLKTDFLTAAYGKL